MFDTIHFTSSWTLTTPKHPDWDISYKTDHIARQGHEPLKGRMSARHRELNIRAYGSYESGNLTKFYIPSLPALLHGQNGMPLNGQPEVDAALAVLNKVLSQIARPLTPLNTYTRIDIPLNLCSLSYRHIEVALQRTNLPRSKTAPVHYIGESLTFRRALTELQFYDKILQSAASKRITEKECRTLPSFTRVELRLKGKDLNRAMAAGKPVMELNVMDAYQCLRAHILSLGLTRIEGVTDHESFLARVAVDSPELLDLYLGTRSPAYSRQLRRKVSALMPLVADKPIDWERILPVAHPPVETQFYIPGSMGLWQRELVAEVRREMGIGLGPEHVYEAHRSKWNTLR